MTGVQTCALPIFMVEQTRMADMAEEEEEGAGGSGVRRQGK